ncbi:hypothetical protein OIU77_024648 [Salix suchowensis]|uniref:Serine aminopeptidase S33 domain-containing protein n=1 Tax=Salix suchowensis TaxID=1278906 RepID=A0ABQ9BW15_9ROSI|nr:hypothetical protein OIU77_024648 [Salix suchowensis]
MLRTSMMVEESLKLVTLPFVVLHGDADTVTDPEISKALYDRARSKDKTMKLYAGMWHALTAGETDENVGVVFADIIAWLDKHAAEGNLLVEPLHETFNVGIQKLPSPPPAAEKHSHHRSYLCGFKEPRTLHSAM